jgi:ribosomal protein S18 acetylase RimI-like enzyme
MIEFSIARVESVTAELLTAFERLMPQLNTVPIPTNTDLQKLLDSPSVLIVARSSDLQDQIVGAATLGVFRTPSGLHAHIEDVVVDNALRGRGCGEALVRHLLLVARELGLDGISLTCNPRRIAANRLYKKIGFLKWKTNMYWFAL